MTGEELVILSLFPEVLNIHGDSQNARVLAARASWVGTRARVVSLGLGEEAPASVPDAVVIGSGFDADAAVVHAALMRMHGSLLDWHAAGVPILAIGTGWELLSNEVEIRQGEFLAGAGVFPGRAVQAGRRTSGEIIVDSVFGRLVGYEYHSRHYLPAEGETALGTVVAGIGNGTTADEGSIVGNAIGSQLRGPILARNPALADHLLSLAGEHAGISGRSDPDPNRNIPDPNRDIVDAWAESANDRIQRSLRRRRR